MATKVSPHLEAKTYPLTHFWECCVVGVFGDVFFCVLRFFGFWVAGGSILGAISALFGRLLVPLNVSKT